MEITCVAEEENRINEIKQRFIHKYKMNPILIRYDVRLMRDVIDLYNEYLVLELEGMVKTEKKSATLKVSLPSSWWQHIKSIIPILRKFPIKYKTHEYVVYFELRYLHEDTSDKYNHPILVVTEIKEKE